MSTETLRQALKDCLDWMESLRACGDAGNWEWGAASEYAKGIAALEAKDEPVAWMNGWGDLFKNLDDVERGQTMQPLYTNPPQRTWDELTLAEVKEAYAQHARHQIEDMGASGWVEFADTLQTILRSKNT